MTTATAPRVGHLLADNGADVDIVIPVFDEELALEPSVRRLHAYLTGSFPLTWTVTIADNASRDRTWGIACRLADDLPGVRAVHLDAKGRGRALRAAWTTSEARVVAYMDVDLSTGLDALLPLVAPLLSGHSDIAIGSRLTPDSRVVRGTKRELISRGYNLVLKATVHNRFTDAQCGFKAARTEAAEALLPLIEDDGWFFDTELLILAEHNGLRIHEVPVDWVDDPDSRVHLASTARDDLRGICRLLRRFVAGEGTLPGGSLAGAGRRPRTAAGAVTAFGPGLLTVPALLALRVGRSTSLAADLLTITAIYGLATLGRFVILRTWVCRSRSPGPR